MVNHCREFALLLKRMLLSYHRSVVYLLRMMNYKRCCSALIFLVCFLFLQRDLGVLKALVTTLTALFFLSSNLGLTLNLRLASMIEYV